ncbi:MAG: hypothetical protein A2Y86_03530 [Candidatus Aminicenantes bacterium RBG_13_62_12]|nr:MAG: hypothetical protein A2Y86_03530 [Candidatus Aminicenantes bacterium RBG_13_62_12]
MNCQHQSLASGRWRSLSLIEQLANIGSEVERALNWRDKGNPIYSQRALERALELIGLTVEDPRHRARLKEITRLREAILDYFLGENLYQSSSALWRKYFYAFGYAARSRIK